VKRIERVRLYPTPRQERALQFMLDVTRELYNALLQERRDTYRLRKATVSAKEQYVVIRFQASARVPPAASPSEIAGFGALLPSPLPLTIQ
jgi:Helix-turn-helix domain